MKPLGLIVLTIAVFAALPTTGRAEPHGNPAEVVRDILSQPDDELDYRRAKLAFDRLVDSSMDAEATFAEVEALATSASALAGPGATPTRRLSALRRVIYESGHWNGNRPFGYDHADPRGVNVRNKLLATYLATRRGNCVSMPILLLLVGERMGLNLSLSTAPLHMFIRYTDENGREINLEATSGGYPARTLWYRENLPMSDRAIESGLYMRTLTRREAIADLILQHDPRDGYTLAKRGTAYGELLRTEFVERFAAPALIPVPLRQSYLTLARENLRSFKLRKPWDGSQRHSGLPVPGGGYS